MKTELIKELMNQLDIEFMLNIKFNYPSGGIVAHIVKPHVCYMTQMWSADRVNNILQNNFN